MFIRDKELRPRGRDDRERVLEKAQKLREERLLQREREAAARRVQPLARAWAQRRTAQAAFARELDAKLDDIARLKTMLQRQRIPLPWDALFGLLRLALFSFRAQRDDVRRIDVVAGLVADTIAETQQCEDDAAILTTVERRWQLCRLVERCLEGIDADDARRLVGLVARWPSIRKHLCSSDLRLFMATESTYSSMPALSLPGFARQVLLKLRESVGSATNAGAEAIVQLAIDATDENDALSTALVTQVISVPLLFELTGANTRQRIGESFDLWLRILTQIRSKPLALPPSPVNGIASSVWLLGNVLAIADRVPDRRFAVEESDALCRLLEIAPPETFATGGGTVAWTKVSESHSVPVVFPDALNRDLQCLVKERYLHGLCFQLLQFDSSCLHRPLDTTRPVPSHPLAPTLAEQFGFGDIASSQSFGSSLTEKWERVRSLGRSSWARRLLEKAGLKKPKQGDVDRPTMTPPAHTSLRNLSLQSRELAAQGLVTQRHPGAGVAYGVDKIFALARMCSLFLVRWGHATKLSSRMENATKMLNALAFCAVADAGSGGSESSSSVSFVRVLWCVLQDHRDIDDYLKHVNLLGERPDDGYVCTFLLFCASYSHLLLVLDDEEMYEDEFPLPLSQLERLVAGLKHALFAAYWTHGQQITDPASIGFGMFVVDAAARLLVDLYKRCSRVPFCNVSTWVLSGLNTSSLIDEVLAGTPRANKLIASIPFIVPFPERVKLFQRLVQADKSTHQGDGLPVFRVRIRRAAVLEDGLSKLNVIRGNLKKKINVVFVNAAGSDEVGIDAGGLFKEFWLDLANLAFDLEYGLFLTTPGDQLLYPNPHASSSHFARESDHLTLFQFVGRILGKALYEGIVVQPKFAHFFLSKLLHSHNHLNELPSLDQEIYKNLLFLKSYEGDVEDLGLTFTVVQDVFGAQQEVELVPNGASLPVTNHNKIRYIHLVAHYYLNTQIREQSAAFRTGLADLIDTRWLQLFNEPELQVLISGKGGDIDVDDLRAHTRYAGGYHALDRRVKWLWQALESFSPAERAAFLRFTTSCQRAPSLGFATLTPPFCVQKIPIRSDDELLPSSSTCFNTLKLPTYSSARTLRAKLLLAISSGAGFEMS
ncbi:hypothetical protein PINS_up010038 [Pythium insidiosum]|nr:hypothetical protein PINS_up010038 [Pythium insidiosum]